MTDAIRLRFAPSPTGKLHIGGARTALFNWAYARRHGGRFVLRVEDTDRERSTPEFEVAILDGLRWLGIDWDEGPEVGGPFGPYRQSERLEGHLEAARSLLEAGRAYPCFCSAERLSELRERQTAAKETTAYDRRCRDVEPGVARERVAAGEPHVLRFRVPPGETRFADMIRGDVRFQNDEVDDWIMVRTDGSPTYNFVVVCDDVAMRISHVMRGEEHLTNTPKQVLLYEAFDVAPPAFAHLPLMLGTDGKKLSKRTGDTALQDYRDHGYPAAAVLNFLCLQGWALDDKTEIFSIDQLVARFDPHDVGKRGAIFDPEKFLWMSGEYLRAESDASLAGHALPFVVAAGLMDTDTATARRAWYERAVASVKERVQTYAQVAEQLAYLFAADDTVPYDEQAEEGARKHADAKDTLATYLEWLRPRLDAGADELREATRAWVQERGLKLPALFQPLRCALTGMAGGPDLFEVMELLGSERTVRRIARGIERL